MTRFWTVSKRKLFVRTRLPTHRVPRPRVEQRIDAVRALSVADRLALSVALTKFLGDRSARVRWVALDVVKDEILSDLEPRVIELLADPETLVRDIAVECLGALHQDEGISASWLYPLLDDEDWLIRIETIESLAQIGDKSSRPLIAKLLEDSVALVRGYAATHLVMLGGSKYRKMIGRRAGTEREEEAQVRFASALFELGDESQFSQILKYLSSERYQVRCAAANILADLPLSEGQVQAALSAVSYARLHYLYRGDQSTMEKVEKELQEQVCLPLDEES
jgi:hypothetical protein